MLLNKTSFNDMCHMRAWGMNNEPKKKMKQVPHWQTLNNIVWSRARLTSTSCLNINSLLSVRTRLNRISPYTPYCLHFIAVLNQNSIYFGRLLLIFAIKIIMYSDLLFPFFSFFIVSFTNSLDSLFLLLLLM